MNGVLAALIVELGLITYRGVSQGGLKGNPVAPLPVPAELAGAVIVFGVLSMIPGRGQTPATVFAWGLVLATGLNFYSETGAPRFTQAPLTFIAPGSVPSS
jgi:hypothetical protein